MAQRLGPRAAAGGRGRGRGPPPPPKEGHVKHMLGAVAALRTDERLELRPGTHGLMGRRSPPRGGQVRTCCWHSEVDFFQSMCSPRLTSVVLQ